jgi:hypothetical protein
MATQISRDCRDEGPPAHFEERQRGGMFKMPVFPCIDIEKWHYRPCAVIDR